MPSLFKSKPSDPRRKFEKDYCPIWYTHRHNLVEIKLYEWIDGVEVHTKDQLSCCVCAVEPVEVSIKAKEESQGGGKFE